MPFKIRRVGHLVLKVKEIEGSRKFLFQGKRPFTPHS